MGFEEMEIRYIIMKMATVAEEAIVQRQLQTAKLSSPISSFLRISHQLYILQLKNTIYFQNNNYI